MSTCALIQPRLHCRARERPSRVKESHYRIGRALVPCTGILVSWTGDSEASGDAEGSPWGLENRKLGELGRAMEPSRSRSSNQRPRPRLLSRPSGGGQPCDSSISGRFDSARLAALPPTLPPAHGPQPSNRLLTRGRRGPTGTARLPRHHRPLPTRAYAFDRGVYVTGHRVRGDGRARDVLRCGVHCNLAAARLPPGHEPSSGAFTRQRDR
jgi:hypothetical protein